MCIIFLAYRTHPKYSLVVTANRDEEHSRPSAPLHFWEDYPQVLAGRDMRELGTWMGITRNGRFAALTNYRGPQSTRQNAKSRGELVKQFLISDDSPVDYLGKVSNDRRFYNGFNILVGDKDHLCYYSGQEDQIKMLLPGIYGLSNAHLDTPWPKIMKGKAQLEHLLQSSNSVISETAFAFMADVEQAKDEQLPNTGVGIERERTLSSIFIHSPHYGTRSTTILAIGSEGVVEICERSYDQGGVGTGDQYFSFQME